MPVEDFKDLILYEESFILAISLGVLSYYVHFFVSIFFAVKYKSVNNDVGFEYSANNKFADSFYIYVTMSIILIFLTYYLKLGSLTGVGVELPYKLTGILVLTKRLLIPFALLCYADFWYYKDNKKFNLVVILFIIYQVVNGVLIFSKGALFIGLTPLIFLFLYKGVLRKKYVAIVAALFFVTILFYKGAQDLRDIKKFQGYDVSISDVQVVSGITEVEDSLFSVLSRIFKDGLYLCEIGQKFNGLYDENRFKDVIKFKGSANYYTRVIMKIPYAIKTSLGTALLSDAFLVGGFIFCIFTIILMSMFSVILDCWVFNLRLFNPVLGAFLTYFFFTSLVGGWWEIFFRMEINIVIWPICFFQIWFLNKKLKNLGSALS
jgi:hypothetical protein